MKYGTYHSGQGLYYDRRDTSIPLRLVGQEVTVNEDALQQGVLQELQSQPPNEESVKILLVPTRNLDGLTGTPNVAPMSDARAPPEFSKNRSKTLPMNLVLHVPSECPTTQILEWGYIYVRLLKSSWMASHQIYSLVFRDNTYNTRVVKHTVF